MTVGVNPPKTPVTKGSNGIAAATVPNVCKMPGPPAPFVPAPLPNIGKSGDSPKGYTKKVKVEGNPVAIKGATFKSMGDMASKGTGGGLVSANTHGVTKFVSPGSMNVKFEGKNVQLLGDIMLNNCGPSGSPPNSATLAGTVQAPDSLKKLIGDDEAQAVCDAICANYGKGGKRGKGTQDDLDNRTPKVGDAEQTQWLPSAGGTAAKGRTAAGTFQDVLTRAGNVARSSTACGRGNTVRWDRRINGKWIEFKGDKESYTKAQRKAIKQSGGTQPDATVRPSDCGCPE